MASRSAAEKLPSVILTVVLIGLILFIGVSVVSSVIAVQDTSGSGDGERVDTQGDLIPSGGEVTVSGDDPQVQAVHQSLNDSAELDGGDSITGPDPNLDDTWTVSTWARVNDSTTDRLLYTDNGTRWLTYNATNDEYACWRYDDSTAETHRVGVNAPSEADWTNVQCEHDGSTLTVSRNGTNASTSVVTDATNATSATLTTDNLNGSLDETRVFNGTLSAAQRDQLYTRPTAPLDAGDRTARVMYDTYDSDFGGSIPVYIQGASLDESGVEKGVGLQGENPEEGTDYDVSGDTITLTDGGELDAAPVVFVKWSYLTSGNVLGDTVDQLAANFGAAIVLGGVLMLLLVVGVVIMALRETR